MTALMSVYVLLGSGVLAGVLFAVVLGVVPTFAGLQPQEYVRVHILAGKYYDMVMPPMVITTTVVDVVLAASSTTASVTVLFLCAAVLQVGVSLVSQFGNVPINRVVKRTDPLSIDENWSDPRARWRRLHSARTVLAGGAFVCTACAVVLAR